MTQTPIFPLQLEGIFKGKTKLTKSGIIFNRKVTKEMHKDSWIVALRPQKVIIWDTKMGAEDRGC